MKEPVRSILRRSKSSRSVSLVFDLQYHVTQHGEEAWVRLHVIGYVERTYERHTVHSCQALRSCILGMLTRLKTWTKGDQPDTRLVKANLSGLSRLPCLRGPLTELRIGFETTACRDLLCIHR